MNKIPLMVDLSNKNILIIGGGTVAERRARRIYNKCKTITIISPAITDGMKALTEASHVTWLNQKVMPTDLLKKDMIIIATNDPVINQMVLNSAPDHTWINATHAAEKGQIDFPLTLERGKLQIAISTGAASPILAKKIKNELDQSYPEDYANYVEFLFNVRKLVKQSWLQKEQKQEILSSLVENPIFDAEQQADFLVKLKEQM
ncbi:NAD(P)-binding protein [Gracilibacillus oryzae]|uniref:precorrin-2 dehydrogenase n=1 Tax=Gracilibacillus oryzae TaxID=1672701 RepID=A0A7C8KSN5_9BACI|nr:NAD(P)-binding protein [Gracilibacillus oryzae]KAB8138901.1 NAD(P)-binding protein [Gracilibacillus oryzae]